MNLTNCLKNFNPVFSFTSFTIMYNKIIWLPTFLDLPINYFPLQLGTQNIILAIHSKLQKIYIFKKSKI